MGHYLLTEQGHSEVIAVIQHPNDELELLQKVNEAIKEHFCYKNTGIARIDDDIEMFEVHGFTDDDDREIREVRLDKVAIY